MIKPPFTSCSRQRAQQIAVNLLSWYSIHARNLPWRKKVAPYKTWVSEIMLQQTQVATVIPYYERWVKKFPNIQSLAAASVDEVMRYWAGLGYYRRAKMLHEGAQYLVQHHHGELPDNVFALRKIPGIGRYTAGAIASIAFQKKEPLLDGNVIRVLSRIFRIEKNVEEKETLDHLWSLATSLVPNHRPGDFNQALMELGALICTPQLPACPACPCKKLCQAFKHNVQTTLPVKTRKSKFTSLKTYALIIKKNKSVLLRKQIKDEMWAGLWVFPFWREKRAMFDFFSISSQDCRMKKVIRYHFTKYKGELYVYELLSKNRKLPSLLPGMTWCSLSKIETRGFPSPHYKALSLLRLP